jgi:hypothetical protein
VPGNLTVVGTINGGGGGGGTGTTTNPLTMDNSGTGAASGSTFNGSAPVKISYNTIGAAPAASPSFSGTSNFGGPVNGTTGAFSGAFSTGPLSVTGNLNVNGSIITSGPAGIASNTASNSDLNGELTFSSSTTASYTFQNATLNVHPECMFEALFDIGSGNRKWATYTGGPSGTAFVVTLNFATAVSGTVSYLCAGRN